MTSAAGPRRANRLLLAAAAAGTVAIVAVLLGAVTPTSHRPPAPSTTPQPTALQGSSRPDTATDTVSDAVLGQLAAAAARHATACHPATRAAAWADNHAGCGRLTVLRTSIWCPPATSTCQVQLTAVLVPDHALSSVAAAVPAAMTITLARTPTGWTVQQVRS
jgi:hypothetical protein